MRPSFADQGATAIPLYVIDQDHCPERLSDHPEAVQDYCNHMGFTGAIGQGVFAPDGDGGYRAIIGYGTHKTRTRGRFHLAAGAAKLPKGTYALTGGLPAPECEREVLGWLLSEYTFDRYKPSAGGNRKLVAPADIDAQRVLIMAQAEYLCRDLVNTPASDMGPDELEQASRDLANQHQAAISVITGDDLLDQNFPMIHAVGRASPRAPRLIDMSWGQTGPKITLVGKGVCFDTGGLDLKPASGMGLMKKDMGGSANVLALAHMIMSAGLSVQLRVLIPAVENAVSGNAFRPQDVLTSRAGLTVEINNTDAEGRLVLADALAYASEDDPDLVVSMATLTGAARVAVGPDLAPFYAGRDEQAAILRNSAAKMADPVWQMPFHDPYDAMIEPMVADLDNAPAGGFAGSITAALFLRRFVRDPNKYMHFDIYAWTPVAMPARPKGGALQAARALFDAMESLART